MRTNALIILAMFVISCGLIVISVFHHTRMQSGDKNGSYALNLLSGTGYQVDKQNTLRFTIKDDNDTAYKDFDKSDPIPLMVTIIRNDRTNFQHLHPTYNQSDGTFTISPVTFTADGNYRIFASFRSSDVQKNNLGEEPVTTVYQDVQVGNESQYASQNVSGEKLTSSQNGFDTFITTPTDKMNPESMAVIANKPQAIVMKIAKNGESVTDLRDFKGSLGRLSAFGPSLEFVSTNSEPSDTDNQTGTIIFNTNFPSKGLYKIYIEVQLDKTVTTFEYVVNVQQK
jgi:hypothetical protein